jgi:hypothetical protein
MDLLRETFSPFHHFTFPLIVAPIYYEGIGVICITLPDRGLPAVILNLVRDDLRMMAPKRVAAREGAMKQYRDSWQFVLLAASIEKRFFPGVEREKEDILP